MLDFLKSPVHAGAVLKLDDVLLRVTYAALLGAVVAGIYYFTKPRKDEGTKGFIGTIALLAILLAMVVMVVGDDVARAFSLAGALAIVRFRTVVEDSRDSAFVICAVVVGMAAGADYVKIAIIGLPFVALAAYLTQNGFGNKAAQSQLKVRCGLGIEQQNAVEIVLRIYSQGWTVVASSTARQGAAVDISYQIRLKSAVDTAEMVRELNRIEGVQEVEWKA